MDPADLLGALVRGAMKTKPHRKSGKALRYLTGGGRGSFVNASTMLAAAGVAWGLYETWQQGQGQASQASTGNQWGGGGQPVAAPAPFPDPTPSSPAPTGAHPVMPPPIPGAAPVNPASPPADIPPAVLRIVQVTIAAARADGALGAAERESILEQARAVGAGAIVERELEMARPLAQIVAGVSDAREKEELYVLAFAIVRADESLTGAERIFLAQLAALLGLSAETRDRLEQDAARGIDTQDEPR